MGPTLFSGTVSPIALSRPARSPASHLRPPRHRCSLICGALAFGIRAAAFAPAPVRRHHHLASKSGYMRLFRLIVATLKTRAVAGRP